MEQVISRVRAISLLAGAMLCLTSITWSGDQKAASPVLTQSALDPYFSVFVRAADTVFIGSLERLERSDCNPSGLTASLQGMTFNVKKVLKGSVEGSDFTAYHIIMGPGPLEVIRDDCIQLAPDAFPLGGEFIVACNFQNWRAPQSTCVMEGGPWLFDRDSERLVSKAISLGSLTRPQKQWQRGMVDLRRFVEGHDVSSSTVSFYIRFFENLTGLPFAEKADPIDKVSRPSLENQLDVWKAWYEMHGQQLSLDERGRPVVRKVE